MPKICQQEDCTNFVFSKGYCQRHQSLRPDKKEASLKKGELDFATLLELAIKINNTYIRLRDKDKGCISCKDGKVEHAGHFYEAGKYSGVRLNLINVNGQCKICNCELYGNLEKYEKGLIQKYGSEQVEELKWLAETTKFYKWSREELKEIIADRQAKIKELQETLNKKAA